MQIDLYERHRRKILEKEVELNGELIIATEDKRAIREQTITEFIRHLDGKLANLQVNEHLTVRFEIDIIDPTGRVPGGSGSPRNMPEYTE